MRNLKRALIMGFATSLLCGLVLTVGAAQAYQQAAQGGKTDVGSLKASNEQTIEMTHFIGDLYYYRNYQVERPEGSRGIPTAMISEGERPDTTSVEQLIQTYIAPGTWETGDAANGDARLGRIKHTAASGYLVVRHTPDVQKQITALLDNLRPLVKASMWSAIDRVVPGTSRAPIRVKLPSLPQDQPQPQVGAPNGTMKSQSERRERVRQLLRQLQAELEAMDSEGAAPTPPNKIP
jgi:hypothetical protein